VIGIGRLLLLARVVRIRVSGRGGHLAVVVGLVDGLNVHGIAAQGFVHFLSLRRSRLVVTVEVDKSDAFVTGGFFIVDYFYGKLAVLAKFQIDTVVELINVDAFV
jgi:ABC-type thiamin/hydroxymethylpyrimidine transport system permease subunit